MKREAPEGFIIEGRGSRILQLASVVCSNCLPTAPANRLHHCFQISPSASIGPTSESCARAVGF